MMKSNDRHNYEYDVNVNGNTAPAHVVRMVGKNKRVLELGAGPGSITKILKEIGNCRVTGLERDTKAIPKLKNYCERVYEADLNDSSWSTQLVGEADFDIIVAADVLEHVYDPLEVLKTMVDLAGETGQVVVSLPHASHSSVIACLLAEDFEYRDWGLLDRTHIRFFGLKNIQKLFTDAGLTIVDAQFVIVPPEESEFSGKWNNLDGDVKEILSRQPYGKVYQVVLKAVSQAQAETVIDLLSVEVDKSPSALVPRVFSDIPRVLARKYLSHKTRQKIHNFLRK
jgi:2-polyprenyl-3-methyl-5-hydroxy-6-metoxy-1,4-benzoquinol methylase